MAEEQLPLLEDAPALGAAADDDDDDEKPEWLEVLLRTRFWDPCSHHAADSYNRAEECMFCLQCHEVSCPHCKHNVPGHRRLKIRRYVYRSVVLAKDMQELNIDVSRIQTYIINGQRGVHLRPMKRSKMFRPQLGAPQCLTCECWLRTAPNLFCSLTCEGNVDVSQDDFSGPEAERRYRSLQTNMLQERPSQQRSDEPPEAELYHVSEDEDEDEPPPPNYNLPAANRGRHGKRSFRRRARKQAVPARAPFF